VDLFRWKDAQFLDWDRHWKRRRKIKQSLCINAYQAKAGGDLMNLDAGTHVDPCWSVLNNLILGEGDAGAKACCNWREKVGKEHEGNTRSELGFSGCWVVGLSSLLF